MVAPLKRPTEAWRSTSLFTTGMGYVAVARFKASGEVEAGVFLVDTFCLGVKNAFFTLLDDAEYDSDFVERIFGEEGRTALTPACARKLVEDAVAYARSLGLEPHRDYKKGARVFGGIQPAECTEQFVFGKDGKPLYFQGPHDSPAFVERVMGTLIRRLGEGGFHYALATGSPFGEEDADYLGEEAGPGPTPPPGGTR